MVVVAPAETRQEDFLLSAVHRVAVAVGVAVHEDRGRAGNEDTLAEDRDPQRSDELGVLYEYAARVAAAVEIDVLEDEDAIAHGARHVDLVLVPQAVVHRLREPHAAAFVDVDGRGVVEVRRLGPDRQGQARGNLEIERGIGRARFLERR
jgi:hypothetical protein